MAKGRTSSASIAAGRGSGKLEAAIAAFHLEGKIARAHAIDIGSGAGGFVKGLLDHGATKVTTVDVGHRQLNPSLKNDRRVDARKHVLFKTLPVHQLPGPFDFFSVDVSFIPARSLLASLAVRLRPGAEGVILVRPQFELVLHEGRITAEDRKRAVLRIKEKGTPLGFRLLSVIDSPVQTPDGVVEVLAHFVCDGRAARLPKVTEKHSSPSTVKIALPPSADQFDFFAVAAPGLETVVCDELRELGQGNAKPVLGGVEFSGPLEHAMRANLWSRTATRILLRVGAVDAQQFSQLRSRSTALAWEKFVDGSRPLKVRAAMHRCRLYHSGGASENVTHAIADRLKLDDFPDQGGEQEVLIRGENNHFVLSVDASGELLHRRGYREESGPAPLRETLAAGLLHSIQWRPDSAFFDPMCGSGTLPIEACQLARHQAPGLFRNFAFENWPVFSRHREVWQRLREQARTQIRAVGATIVGNDVSATAVAAARRNAERATVLSDVEFGVADFFQVKPPATNGAMLLNPPYGQRVGDRKNMQKFYRQIGDHLRARYAGWRIGVLSDAALISALGIKPQRQVALSSGGLRLTLALFGMFP